MIGRDRQRRRQGRHIRDRRHGGRGWLAAAASVAALALIGAGFAAPSAAGASTLAAPAVGPTISTPAVQAAAAVAEAAGYTTGVAVLDLTNDTYLAAGDDTAAFASESVVKVMIAAQLLATGQMTGSTEATAYQMITQSDDADADALYGLAGGDDVINLIAARYDIPFLGSPPANPGWWGGTQITAKGMVYLYAAIANDPVVGPWLMNAMANAAQYGSDGTYQFFGIPSATTGFAVKQGWGDDGTDSPNAVFNTTGYVDDDQYAVAILTDGPPDSYGSQISAMLTQQAQQLMPGGQIDDPVRHNPTVSAVAASAKGDTVTVTGTATDPDESGALPVVVDEGATQVGAGTADPVTHMFTISVAAAPGAHTYTASAANVGEGTAAGSAVAAPVTVAATTRSSAAAESAKASQSPQSAQSAGTSAAADDSIWHKVTDGLAVELATAFL